MLIRLAGTGVTLGAFAFVQLVTSRGVITPGEATAVITIGSVALVVHLTAGWASRGVIPVAFGDNPRDLEADRRYRERTVTVRGDRHIP